MLLIFSDAEINAAYAQWFTQASANAETFYFKASGGSSDILTCSSFSRADHAGTFSVNGTAVPYDCLKIE